jgi:AI-2 transport protein TqsA
VTGDAGEWPSPPSPPRSGVPPLPLGLGAPGLRGGLLTLVLVLAVIILVTVLLRELAVILQPLLVAFFLCYLILPAHHWLVRHKVPSLLSYLLVGFAILVLMYGFGSIVYTSVDELRAKLPGYIANLEDLVKQAIAALSLHIPALRDVQIEDLRLFDGLSAERITGMLAASLGTFIGFLASILIVLIYLMFLMAESRSFERRLKLALGEERALRTLGVVGSVNRAIGQFLVVKSLVSLLVAGLSTAVLGGFGVDFFLLWGILTFFANFIPYIGSLAATILPVTISLLQFPGVWHALVIACLLTACQVAMAYFVEPALVGRRLGLSPVMILLALAYWGVVWGITGMILAVPLMVILKIILENFEETRPVATMISNM